MDFINLVLMSSVWDKSHRKGFYTELNRRFSVWSDVVFIQAGYSILVHFFLKFLTFNKYSNSIIKGNSGMRFFTPVILFHNRIWNIIPLTLKIDSWLIYRQLQKFMKANVKDLKVLMWSCHPFDHFIVRKMSPYMSIFDFYDNFSFDENGELNELKDCLNRLHISSSDLIFTTSITMKEFAAGLSRQALLVPNGYNPVSGNETERGAYPENSKIIGYIGNIREWIDFQLIEKLLSSLDGNEYLVFVGPVSKGVAKIIDKLKANERFIHLKEVPYSKVINYIRGFDIAIIPFRRNRFTDGVNPNKFFEYIAGDACIVSTDLPDLLLIRDSINVARTIDDFISMCKSDVSSLNFGEEKYQEIKRDATWENRIKVIEETVRNKIAELISD